MRLANQNNDWRRTQVARRTHQHHTAIKAVMTRAFSEKAVRKHRVKEQPAFLCAGCKKAVSDASIFCPGCLNG